MRETILCARLSNLRDEVRSRGLDDLRSRAEECIEQRGGHSYSRMVNVPGQTEYCVYCLAFKIRGSVIFDPLTATSQPRLAPDGLDPT